MALAKTVGTAWIALQQLASNSILLSAPVDVSGKYAISIYVWIGRDDTTGLLAAPAIVRVQGSPDAAGDRYWQDVNVVATGTALPEAEAVVGTAAAGQTVVNVASTTNLAVGDLILLKHPTIGSSEFRRIVAVATNVSVTLQDALTNAQTGSTIYDQAQMWMFSYDLTGLSIQRIRLMIDGAATGRTLMAEARYTTTESL